MASDDLFGTDSDSGNDTDDLIASAKKQPSSKATGTNKSDGSPKQKKRLGAAKKIATKRLEKTKKAAAKKKNDIPAFFFPRSISIHLKIMIEIIMVIINFAFW